MKRQLHKELEELKRELLGIGAMAEDAIKKSILALFDRRSDLATEIIAADQKIDEREVELEEMCLRILALNQPVAVDLRFITAVMKINNDLERMADCAVSIAKRARHLAKDKEIPIPKNVKVMSELVVRMVRECLDALADNNVESARSLAEKDKDVDALRKELIKELRSHMQENPDTVDSFLDIFTTIARLERIADHTTNIAEDVVYIVEGQIIRHQG